jgi:hypothetical protein
MKKYKKTTFTFSLLSLLGFLFGLLSANDTYSFNWSALFGFWITLSLPLIVLWIYTKIFD